MGIQVSRDMVERALPKVAVPLRKYAWLQRELGGRDVSSDPEYRKRFSGFYRVRRAAAWKDAYFRILEREKAGAPTLPDALVELHAATGRVEASFASKLVATVDPRYPVIDSIVLGNLGLSLRFHGDLEARVRQIASVHERMVLEFADALASAEGRHLVARFRETYPDAQVTDVKKLDLVLWQTR